jgi:hypothetical protein
LLWSKDWSIRLKNRKWHLGMLIAALVIAIIVGFRLRHPHLPEVAKLPAPTRVPAPPQIPPLVPTTPDRTPASIAQHAGKSIEICGIGTVSGDDADADARELFNQKLQQGRSRWLTSMLQSGDNRVHATGLLFESRFTGTGDWLTKPAPEKAVNALVDLALGAEDPMVYAMAVFTCKPVFGPAPGGSCDQISAKGWAAIDQDNAAAWMAVAREARSAKDTAAQSAAFSRAANATRFDNYGWALSVTAEPTLPADIGPLERYRLSYELASMADTFSPPPFNFGAQGCTASEIADVTLRSECSSMAELLVSKANTVNVLSMAASLGAQIGWPKERLSALKDKSDALQGLIRTRGHRRDEPNPWSCGVANNGNAFMRDWQQFGELGAYERLLEQSGKTTAELAQEFREYLAEMQHRMDELRKSKAQPEP